MVGSVGSGLGSKWPFTLRKPTTAVGKKKRKYSVYPQQRFAQLLSFWCRCNLWISSWLDSIIGRKQEDGILEVLFFSTAQRYWSQKHIWIPKHNIWWQSHLTFISRWAILSLSFILHSKEVQRSPHCCNRNDEMTIMTYHGNHLHCGLSSTKSTKEWVCLEASHKSFGKLVVTNIEIGKLVRLSLIISQNNPL